MLGRVRADNIKENDTTMISRVLAVIKRTLLSVFRRPHVKAGHRRSGGHGGRNDPNDGSVSVGVTVPLKPPPPVLIGKDAKPIPKSDNDADQTELAA
jgi:hypothetical protein